MKRKERGEEIDAQAKIFLNDTDANKRLFWGYKLVVSTCIVVHAISFFLLFVDLDPRFTFLGYDFWNNR